ncbi:FecR family protein [Chitinophaga sp. CC14]|uniref:FecR family protein n=1 Tax=Chitinophaga sp. CC14 TaxID=3029199 RepID=UPI003B7FD33D
MEEKVNIMVRMGKLTGRFISGNLTDAEERLLNDWVEESEENKSFFLNFINRNLDSENTLIFNTDPEVKLAELKAVWRRRKIKTEIFRALRWAAVIAMLTWAGFHLVERTMKQYLHITQNIQEIQPGTQMATLILGNGDQVKFKRGTDTTIMKNKTLLLRQHNGLLSYRPLNQTENTEFNTLIVPRGGEYHLQLSDGTMVWLNAASSIRFPTTFSKQTREVEVSGEAYFDVAKEEASPFIISTANAKVLVLGTKLNINTYTNNTTSTTLVSGSVRIINAGHSIILKPQQCAVANAEGLSIHQVDVSPIIAWKDGLFIFDQVEIPQLMNEIEKWYDLQIEYAPDFKPGRHFSGKVSRYVPISNLLNMIAQTGVARFEIKGQKVIVMQGPGE